MEGISHIQNRYCVLSTCYAAQIASTGFAKRVGIIFIQLRLTRGLLSVPTTTSCIILLAAFQVQQLTCVKVCAYVFESQDAKLALKLLSVLLISCSEVVLHLSIGMTSSLFYSPVAKLQLLTPGSKLLTWWHLLPRRLLQW